MQDQDQDQDQDQGQADSRHALARGVVWGAAGHVLLALSRDAAFMLSEMARRQLEEEMPAIIDAVEAIADPEYPLEDWELPELDHDIAVLHRLGVLALQARWLCLIEDGGAA